MVMRYYPLYGARCEGRSLQATQRRQTIGRLAAGIDFVLPSQREWRMLQSTDTTHPDGVWDPEAHLPWPCIRVDDDPLVPAAGVAAGTAAAHAAVVDAVLALRLDREGWFLDPALSEVIEDHPHRLLRRMGAYRMTYHDEDTEAQRRPEPLCYRLDAGAFGAPAAAAGPGGWLSNLWPGRRAAPRPTPEPAAPTRLLRLYGLLQQERARPVASTRIALQAFSRSEGPGLQVDQQLMLLSLALEAALGRIDEPDGPRARALAAGLHRAGLPDASARARWIATDLPALRNAVAHGRRVRKSAEQEVVQPLREVLRPLLRLLVAYSAAWRAGSPEGPHEGPFAAASAGASAPDACRPAFVRALAGLGDGSAAADWALLAA